MLVAAPGCRLGLVRRSVVLLLVLVGRLESLRRQRVGVRVRPTARGTEEAAQTDLAEALADNRLDNGQVGHNKRHKRFTASPSTTGNGTSRPSL